jgi:hypothetical protein
MQLHVTSICLFVLIPLAAAIPAAPSTQSEANNGSARASAGVRAYIDPVTGKLTQGTPPGAATRYLPAAGLEPDNSKLEVVHHPNGAIQVKFHGQRQATTYATLAKDGTVQTHCVEDTADLSSALPSGEHHE